MNSRHKQVILALALLTTHSAGLASTCLAATGTPAKDKEPSSTQKSEPEWQVEYYAGLKLNSDGDFEKASLRFKKALKLLPAGNENIRAMMNQDLGTALYQLGEYREALALFTTSTQVFEKNEKTYKKDMVLGYEMLSRTYRHLGQPAEAEGYGLKSLNMCAALNGKDSADYALNLRNMGKLYIALYRFLDAEDVLKQAIAIFDKTKKIDDDQLAVCLGFLHYSLVEQDKTSEANKLLVRLEPLEKKLGKSYHSDDQQEKGQEIDYQPFMRVLKYSIKKTWTPSKTTDTVRSVVFFKIHKNGTISDLKIECPSGDPLFDGCCTEAVESAFARPLFPPKGSPEAIDIQFTFDKSLLGDSEISGGDGKKRFDPVAIALKLIDKHNYKEARTILLMPELKNSVKANLALSKIENKLERGVEAEKYARKAMELSPQDAEAHYQCANSLVTQLKFAEALHSFQEVIQLKPQADLAKKALINIYLLQDDLDHGGGTLRAVELLRLRKVPEALQILEKVKARHPNDEIVEYYLSEAYSALGKPADALKHIKLAIAISPDDVSYRIREAWLEQQLGHGQNSLNILREVLKTSPPEPTLSYVKELIASDEKNGAMQTIVNDKGRDYFDEFAPSDLQRWKLNKDQSLNVFIASGDYVPGYRDELKSFILEALQAWTIASQGKIKFNQVKSADSAQIIVQFVNDGNNAAHAAEGGRTRTFGGSTQIKAAIVYIETELVGSNDEDYRVCCLHETGHALGLGHSKSDKDIMYFALTPRKAILTQRDRNTLEHLYSDTVKFPEWALLDEEALVYLEKFQARQAITALEKALSQAPDKRLIEQHLSRAYGLAVCENLANHTLGDSHQLLEKATPITHDPQDLKHLNDLKQVIDTMGSMSETERTMVLEILKDTLKWPPKRG